MADPVVRVQSADGRGPYRPGFSWRWSDPQGPLVMPWWEEIGLSMREAHSQLTPEYHWGCGFRTMDQLHSWFTSRELSKLSRLGFAMVRIIPAVVVAETPTQVVFGTVEPLSEARPRIRLASDLVRTAA